jgi:hypothetical protein
VSKQDWYRTVCRAHLLHHRGHAVNGTARILGLMLGFILSVSGLAQARVVVNEVMASNATFLADPQGDFDDWIELYNAGDTAVDLGGMYLTDDRRAPTKWQIPTGNRPATTLAAGDYLLIWADGDVHDNVIGPPPGQRASGRPPGGFHASFRLSAAGEAVYLFDTDGVTLLDSLVFGEQRPDISFGRYPDGGETLRFFYEPTPGGPNNEGYLGVVAPLRFSHERGIYSPEVTRLGGPGFDLAITTATPGARIIYTLDGKAPDVTNGYPTPPGREYTGPIHIVTTTILRAMAVKPGYMPTKIHTHTYIFDNRETIRSLPVVSLVGDPGQTFYEPDGVMAIVGGTYAGGPWNPTGPDSYNNPMQRGLERPVSAEWFFFGVPDSGFHIDCGLRVHGSNYTRPRYVRQNGLWSGYGKFGFRLYFRNQYGPRRLEYPLFPLTEVERFKSLVLRAGHNDRTNPFIKDELLRRLHQDMGQVAATGTFANLFVNGEHKGYYNPTQHVKSQACQEWFDSDKPWDVMTQNGIRDGDAQAWNTMINLARTRNMADPAAYAELCQKLDVVNFIDYLIIRLWPNDWDWPQNNWSAACERSETGRWRFFVWDAEGTFESGQLNNDRFNELNSQGNANGYLYRALKANRDFRLLFADRLYKHFFNGGALTQQNVTRRFYEMQNELRTVIPNMNTYIVDGWTPSRQNIFLNACIREGLYTFAGPSFLVGGTPRYGGRITAGQSLQMVPSRSGAPIYYTLDGTDPAGVDSPQTAEVTTLVARTAPKRVLVPTGPVAGDWRSPDAFNDSQWLLSSGAPGGVGYERSTGYEHHISLDVGQLMYNINGSCYIRIPFQFTGDKKTLAAMTLRMQYDDGFVAYLNSAEVARRNFNGTPAWNSVASAANPDSLAVLFESIDISSHIDKLRPGVNVLAIHGLNTPTTSSDFLINAELAVTKAVPQPGQTDSHLYTAPIPLTRSTVVKARVREGNTWSALAEAVFAVGPVKESLRVSEIMYHPSGGNDPNGEYVELTNIGAQPINLNRVQFTRGIRFTFPDVELAPGAFCLVVNDRETFEALYGPGLPIAGEYTGRLSNSGERIELRDALDEVILDFRYRDDWFDITDGMGFSLTVVDPAGTLAHLWGSRNTWRPSARAGGSPGFDDRDEVPAPGTVVINELLANSAGLGPDWIELHNTSNRAVDIGGWFLSDNRNELTRYQIAEGTVLPPYGYLVLTESAHFGNPKDPGSRRPFALSRMGEAVYLHSGDRGELAGYSEQAEFGPSDLGVTFGRYEDAPVDAGLVPLTEPTPGAANADPLVGPVVITEIMYHTNNSPDVEYVELLNISDADVTLYDALREAPWRFTDDPESPRIDLLFPDDPPISMAPGEYLLLVKDRTLFASRFSVLPAVQILEWGAGNLSNSGQTIQLSRPGDPDSDGRQPWIAVDRIRYSNGARHEGFPTGLDPWPAQANGQGMSLTRISPEMFGDDPANWQAATPSPGAARSLFNR